MPVKLNRRVVRETAASVYERGELRRVIVQLEAGGSLLNVRLKGQRKCYPVTYAELFKWAVRCKVDSDKRIKAKEREANRKSKEQ